MLFLFKYVEVHRHLSVLICKVIYMRPLWFPLFHSALNCFLNFLSWQIMSCANRRCTGWFTYTHYSEATWCARKPIHLLYNGLAFQSIHLYYWNPRQLWTHCLCHNSLDHYLPHEWYFIYVFLFSSCAELIELFSSIRLWVCYFQTWST